MGKVLIKRALRDLRANKARYIALAALIIFSIFIVVSLMASAVTVIEQTKLRDRELNAEDGEFTVFVPLKDHEIKAITDRGVTIEKMFYLDYNLNSEQVLRVFKVRKDINLLSAVEGELPQNDNEVFMERRFAEVNGYDIGDVFTLAGREFTVAGIGATPDYNATYRKISDTVVDSKTFGLIFVTDSIYDEMNAEGSSVSSEEYCYSYRLNDSMTSDELKDMLEGFHFDAEEVEDEYFLEYWDRLTGRKNEVLEGLDDLTDGARELSDGAQELSDGVGELYDGVEEFDDGMSELNDAMPDLIDGASAISSGAAELESGVNAYTAGVNTASEGADVLYNGAAQIADSASTLEAGSAEYSTNINAFGSTIEAMTGSSDMTVAGTASSLAGPAGALAEGYSQIDAGISGISEGASSMADGARGLSDGLGELSGSSRALSDGASGLRSGANEMRNGLNDLSEGVSELYDGSNELRDGVEELSDGAAELASGARELYDGVAEFSDKANDLIDEVFDIDTSNLMLFMTADENARIDAAADDVEINYVASVVVGILLVMLFAYVISVFIVHTIDQESMVIGALYSLGVKRRTLTLSYVAVPVIVSFLAGAAGTVLAITTPIGIDAQLQDSLNYFSMPVMETMITPSIFIYGLVIPPVMAFIVNVLVIRKRLMRTPLSLLKNEQKAAKGKDIQFKRMKFINMFRLRQMLRESRSGLTVVFGMFMSLLVALLAVNTLIYCKKVEKLYVEQTNYEYMYSYKYPTEEVPEGGYEAVAEDMTKDFGEYTFDITLLGITNDNPFFVEGELPDNNTDVILSTAVAYKYDLKVGDEFTLNNKNADRIYAFRVAGIVDYSASMLIFTDIDRVRDLFNERGDYYNVVFSDHELDIESGRLFSVISKQDIEKSAGVYVSMMMSMIYTMTIGAAVIFVVVMFLMLKMMLDRSSFNIALVKIFGFRDREVRKMYLDGNFYIVAIGALVCIPLCKMIMNYVYPTYLVANVGVGMSQTFPFYIYVLIFVAIMALYLVINTVLVGKIRKMVPAEVLKNRE